MFHSGLNRERLARTPDAHGTKQRGRGAGDEGCGNLVNKVPLSQAVFGLAIPVVQHACQVSVDGLWGDGMLILLLTVLNPAQQAKERKGRERKGRERKGREGKGRERKGRKCWFQVVHAGLRTQNALLFCSCDLFVEHVLASVLSHSRHEIWVNPICTHTHTRTHAHTHTRTHTRTRGC